MAFATTHIPGPALPLDMPVSDKTFHLAGYFPLTVIFVVTLKCYGLTLWRRVAVALAVMAIYGAFDEITQPLFNRSASWGDWLADIVGAATAVLACEAVFRVSAKRALLPVPSKDDD